MTGFAQLRLPPDTDTESVCRKLVYDLYYVQRYSFWLDLRILFLTCARLASAFIKPVVALVDLPDWNTVCDKMSILDGHDPDADAPSDQKWDQNPLRASSAVGGTRDRIV